MIKSMTGYGRAVGVFADKQITVELRSVNNRYLDCGVKLPRLYSFCEAFGDILAYQKCIELLSAFSLAAEAYDGFFAGIVFIVAVKINLSVTEVPETGLLDEFGDVLIESFRDRYDL